MNESIDISSIMIGDHCKIEKLIDDLEEKTSYDFDDMKKSFNQLEWEIEKHIFAEEKAIFTSYNPTDVKEGYKILPELTKQHNYIINQMNKWRNDIKNKRKITDIFSFKKYIIKHKKYEEKEVYPRLDKSLDFEQKKKIISKIKEII